MQYLQDQQYYIDRYDLYTIQHCLDEIEMLKKVFQKLVQEENFKKEDRERQERTLDYFYNTQMFQVKGEEYRRKKKTIEEWIDRDRKEQEKYDNTPIPTVKCPDCGTLMKSESNHLDLSIDDNKPLRVLFFFDCPKCKKREAIYDDGEIYDSKLFLCPECKSKATMKFKRKSNVLTTITKCTVCKYKKIEVDDWDKRDAERNKKEQEEKDLLEKYRDEFCLSEEKGQHYIDTVEKLKFAREVYEFERQKYEDPVYEKSIKIKKLDITELETLLNNKLKKEKYTRLSLGKPEIGKLVIVPFTIQDIDSSRKGKESYKYIEKILIKLLEPTNWRILSQSLSYRLGYIEGRLHGYERDEDILELLGKDKDLKPKVLDPEKLSRYGYDNLVQLARMSGEFEEIESVRKKRLQKEPDGFFLEDSEGGGYTCFICKETRPGSQIWWTPDGLTCADCRRNIKEGVISEELLKKEDELLIRDWQISSDYKVHSSTRRKLEREGKLHPTELKRENGTTYCTIYLVNDNQDFLKTHKKVKTGYRITGHTSLEYWL